MVYNGYSLKQGRKKQMILEFLFYIGYIYFIIFSIIGLMIFVQFISYKVFKFNLYKFLERRLFGKWI